MTEKGFIICRPEENCTLNGLEYLLENDKNEIRHFHSGQEATDFLGENRMDDDSIIIKYHIFCRHCAQEFFFDTEEMPEEEETAFYLCSQCKQAVDGKLKNNN